MASGIILDASTAILLAKVGLLRTVAKSSKCLMTQTAAGEATVKKSDDATMIKTLLDEGVLEQIHDPSDFEKLCRDFRLAEGEAKTILAAKDKAAVCATDDGPAIRCCKVLGVPFTTAIGFLVALRTRGELDEATALELLAKLERVGRYDVRIIEDAAGRIRRAGSKGGRS